MGGRSSSFRKHSGGSASANSKALDGFMGGLGHIPWERNISSEERLRRLHGKQKEWETGKYKNRLEAYRHWSENDPTVSKERKYGDYIHDKFNKLYQLGKASHLKYGEIARGAKLNGGYIIARGTDDTIHWDQKTGKPYTKFEMLYPVNKNTMAILNVSPTSSGNTVGAYSTKYLIRKGDTNWKNYSGAVFGK